MPKCRQGAEGVQNLERFCGPVIYGWLPSSSSSSSLLASCSPPLPPQSSCSPSLSSLHSRFSSVRASCLFVTYCSVRLLAGRNEMAAVATHRRGNNAGRGRLFASAGDASGGCSQKKSECQYLRSSRRYVRKVFSAPRGPSLRFVATKRHFITEGE